MTRAQNRSQANPAIIGKEAKARRAEPIKLGLRPRNRDCDAPAGDAKDDQCVLVQVCALQIRPPSTQPFNSAVVAPVSVNEPE